MYAIRDVFKDNIYVYVRVCQEGAETRARQGRGPRGTPVTGNVGGYFWSKIEPTPVTIFCVSLVTVSSPLEISSRFFTVVSRLWAVSAEPSLRDDRVLRRERRDGRLDLLAALADRLHGGGQVIRARR